MSEMTANEAELVSFSERLANSAMFATMFREGMDLVEETAAYLDLSRTQYHRYYDPAPTSHIVRAAGHEHSDSGTRPQFPSRLFFAG